MSRLTPEHPAGPWQAAVALLDRAGNPNLRSYADWRQADALLAHRHVRTAAGVAGRAGDRRVCGLPPGQRALQPPVEDNLNPVGRLFYAASTTLCTPASLDQEVGLALGAQAGPAKLEAVAHEAGFRSFRVATRTPFNLVLEASG